MKKKGIINVALAGAIAGLGHKDTFLIGDAGMPVPKGVPIIDLALRCGVPTFEDVFCAIVDETEIEAYTLADEIKSYNSKLLALIEKELPNVETTYVPHDELKQLTKTVKFAVRTGEPTPYPNIILRAGVAFAVEEE